MNNDDCWAMDVTRRSTWCHEPKGHSGPHRDLDWTWIEPDVVSTPPPVNLPFDVCCDALHLVQAAGADGLADTLIECAADAGYQRDSNAT